MYIKNERNNNVNNLIGKKNNWSFNKLAVETINSLKTHY